MTKSAVTTLAPKSSKTEMRAAGEEAVAEFDPNNASDPVVTIRHALDRMAKSNDVSIKRWKALRGLRQQITKLLKNIEAAA